MIALFSPSEGKRPGGSGAFRDVSNRLIACKVCVSIFIREYERVLSQGSLVERQALTGWKDEGKINKLPVDLSTAPVLQAMQRYSGVGYQYLDIDTLSGVERSFLAEHVLIFSNLLGPLRAGDLIPETKLKQCNKFAGVNVARYYRDNTSEDLDVLIGNSVVLDLRANVYKQFYQVTGPSIECIFLKNGKRMNHWSKACRGLLLRYFVQQQPRTIEELLLMKTPGLKQLRHSTLKGVVTITYSFEEGYDTLQAI